MARTSVTSSAYSRSPPTGIPRAIRVIEPHVGGQALGQVHRRRLALERRVGGQHDLLVRLAVAQRSDGASSSSRTLQPVRADAVHRRDGAVEDVVAALERAGALDGQDVERLLDDAQPRLVARRVGADRAQRAGRDVEARLAVDDLVAHRDQRRRQRARLSLGRAQQVVGQPLGGLGPDAGQSRECLDEPRDRLDELRPRQPVRPGMRRPPVTRAIFSSAASLTLVHAVVDGRGDQVLEHLDVVRIDDVLVDRDRHDLAAGR